MSGIIFKIYQLRRFTSRIIMSVLCRSIDIIETIIRENPEMNIRLIKGENEGLLANRNRIIEYAKGKYLLICDADDYMADNCLEKLCMAAQEKNADCVIGGFCEVNETGKVYKVHVPKKDANKWIYIGNDGKRWLPRTYGETESINGTNFYGINDIYGSYANGKMTLVVKFYNVPFNGGDGNKNYFTYYIDITDQDYSYSSN